MKNILLYSDMSHLDQDHQSDCFVFFSDSAVFHKVSTAIRITADMLKGP